MKNFHAGIKKPQELRQTVVLEISVQFSSCISIDELFHNSINASPPTPHMVELKIY